MTGSMRALVAEDDENLASLLARALTSRGWTVDTVLRGDAALQSAEQVPYDAILLDVMLPGLSGLEVCRRLRGGGTDAGILMLTARGAIDDRVRGLECGADDYLVKPFALRELHARMDAVIRRRSPLSRAAQGSTDSAVDLERLVVGRLELAPTALEAWIGEAIIVLRPKECAVLAELARRRGHFVTKFDLLESCWDGAVDQQSNVVETTIRRLRDKLRPFEDEVLIETVRGAGYRIVQAKA